MPEPGAAEPAEFVLVGRIGRPHGVKGEVTIEVRTDDPDTRFAVGSVLVTDPVGRGPLTVATHRRSGPVTVLGFDGFADRSAAESLRNTLLLVETAALPETSDPDEFYDHELVGLAVRHVDGTALGTVGDVLHPPAAPVLVVTAPDGSEVLVPFVAAIVPEVDVPGGFITVDPPDGMF